MFFYTKIALHFEFPVMHKITQELKKNTYRNLEDCSLIQGSPGSNSALFCKTYSKSAAICVEFVYNTIQMTDFNPLDVYTYYCFYYCTFASCCLCKSSTLHNELYNYVVHSR